MYKNYLKKSYVLFIIYMLLVSGTNFVIDPGEIYLKRIINSINSKEFSDKLFSSSNGLVQTGWNERLVKTTLARSSGDFNCVIIGSSHIMQISEVRNTGNIRANCKTLLNLGVSGGSLEDLSIFSYLILNNSNLPEKVFLSIDPWTLKFSQDLRYGAYSSIYESMNLLLSKFDSSNAGVSYFSKIVGNILNGEYFYYSILSLIEGKDNSLSLLQNNIIYPNEIISYENGYIEPVTLKDGSHLYKSSFIESTRKSSVAIGGGGYKISDMAYDPIALSYFKKIIKLYLDNSVDIKLVMTPYHPNVFKNGKTKPVSNFFIVENIVKNISQEYNIKYYGSFYPDKLGCKETEFYDYMHATNKCLGRIDFSQ